MANKEAREEKERLELVKASQFREALNRSNETLFDKFLKEGKVVDQKLWKSTYNYLQEIIKESNPDKLALLSRFIKKNAPVLNTNAYFHSFVEISKYPWVRNLDDLVISGKSAEAKLNSIVKHLLVKYSIPQFLYNIFIPEAMNLRYLEGARYTLPQKRFVPLFIHLAQGGSVKKAVKEKLLPTVMTARMHHSFLNDSRVEMTVIEAARYAQILSFGGSKRLWEAICQHKIGREFTDIYEDEEMAAWTPSESWWLTVFQWLCKQPMLDPRQVGPILDYLEARKKEDFSFQIAGRTIANVLLGMERWHEDLNRAKQMKKEVYEPSGIRPGYWKKQTKEGYDFYSITEILTAKELKTEGRAMSHCVVSYASSIEDKRTSIWSFQVNKSRTFTIEVSNRTKEIVQVRGKYNRLITQAEKSWVARWAEESGLRIRYY